MKRLLSIGAVLVLVTLTVGTSVAFGDAPEAEFDIYFVGYCDGLHISTHPDGTVDGWQTGCVGGPILGVKGAVGTQGHAYTIGFDDSAAYWGYLLVLREDHTLTLYANDGGGIYVINTAQWEYGTPLKDAALPVAEGGAGVVEGGSVNAFAVTYDTYCDGARINPLGDGTVDGQQIGCTAGPILGTRGNVLNQGRAIGFTYDDTANFLGFFTVLRVDHTWTHYANDGGGIYVVNSGTWSYGPPPPPPAGVQSSTVFH